jgi:pyridoxamine 5'-phosphate oxidase
MPDDTKNNPEHHGMDVTAMRRSATGFALDRDDLDEDPIVQFEDWFRYACETVSMDPNAVVLSTVDSQARPSSRTVLLKSFDENGFVFYTNYESKKAVQIAENPNVSLLFFWSDAARQVKIRGKAEKISNKESLAYFLSRPRGSQIGAWVSAQSSVISSRSLLENKFQEIKQKFRDKDISLPSFWGGYRVVPEGALVAGEAVAVWAAVVRESPLVPVVEQAAVDNTVAKELGLAQNARVDLEEQNELNLGWQLFVCY